MVKNIKKISGLIIVFTILLPNTLKYFDKILVSKVYKSITLNDISSVKKYLNKYIVNRHYYSNNIRRTLLNQAIIENPDDSKAHEIISLILNTEGIDPNLPDQIYCDSKWINGRRPINWAVERGNVTAVKLLIKAKAELNVVDPISNKAPLEFVKSENNLELRQTWHLDEIEKLLIQANF